MPLFTYVCSKCGHKFEKIAKYDEIVICEAPGCGKYSAKKQFPDKMDFKLKGTGWAKDGYKGKSNNGPTKWKSGDVK